jgi:hypothetical protein
MLGRSPAFRRLDAATQAALTRDVDKIQCALRPAQAFAHADPYAFPLDAPNALHRRRIGDPQPSEQPAQPNPAQDLTPSEPGPKKAATETLAARTGALIDEVNFNSFVAGLIHGTYDAMVDAAIRQMEAFASLVSAVAKDAEQFTEENVTRNQVLDWLAHEYPRDLILEVPVGPNAPEPVLHSRKTAKEDEEPVSPAWLADYGLQGEELTDDLIEQQLLPVARRKVGENRLQTLATMVLLGMNRINVKDGSISAKVRFRAAANDTAQVGYAVSQDPGSQTWGERGSAAYDQHTTMVSTVGVNVQAETDLKAELFGEVRINFVSETLPLDRFVDSARMAVLQRNSRTGKPAPAPVSQPAAEPASQPAQAIAPPPVSNAAPVLETAKPPVNAGAAR